MTKKRREKGTSYREKEGFSLIEVIIAIVMLAVLATPLIAYFTRASVSTSNGKNTQRANMVAQSVTEELGSLDTFEQIEQSLIADTASGWNLESAFDASTRQTKLSKIVTLDGMNYRADVKLDYDYDPVDKDGNTIGAKYNNYDMPKLKQIYSSSNVVIEETDQIDVAKKEALYDMPNKSEADIKSGFERTICLDIIKESDLVARVKGYYEYNYAGAYEGNSVNNTYTASIIDERIEWSKLENVYYFCEAPAGTDTETLKVNFDDSITIDMAEKLNLYFVYQSDVASSYTLNYVPSNGVASRPKYYTNAGTLAGYSGTALDLVTYERSGKRIAKITVDVYAVSDMSERLVSLETTKGE